jgi:ABC-type multidrug transport system fused ATPase/permease subunit
VWKAYIRASGSYFNALVVFILLGLANVANIWTSLWLSYWTSNKYPSLSTGQYIGVYAGLGGSVVLLMFVFSTYMTTCGTNASRTMLQRAMTRVLRAPMSFFDTTPLGRITNRFSKDIQVMDNELSDAMRIYALTMTMIISVMVLIIVFFYYVSDPPFRFHSLQY